jgi:hypothetical protein
MYWHSQVVRFSLSERLWTCTQISPPHLNIGESFGMSTFGFCGVAGL